jgi:hypothetical protein
MRKFTLFFSMFLLSVLAINAQTLETKFTSYSIVGQVSSSIGDGIVEVVMLSDANLEVPLTVNFTLSEGATATIGTVAQVSGTTVDFSAGPVTYTITNGENNSQDWIVKVRKGGGVKQNAQLNADVYPNPANDMLNVEVSDDATVTVVNIIGRVMDRLQINDVNRQVSTSAYPNGTYLVIIESKGMRTVKKVSVIH